jgi:transposase
MFVRKKRNSSGLVSVQIIDKSSGRYTVLKTIGSSSESKEIEQLFQEGKHWIKDYCGQQELDLFDEQRHFQSFISGIQEISIIGTELLLGRLFNQIGFNSIQDELFRYLVFARICFPVSKLKTTEFLKLFFSIEVSEDRIYRYLDKLYKKQKSSIQEISYQHTLQILGNNISVVFYDVTTLYFEIDVEDDLRRTGFSKEGKHQNPQIVLGLLVSIDGYPLAYEIFEGNKFEGHTMLPVIEAFKERYKLETLVIIADAGLLSKKNITQLQTKGYEYILGARIKNESFSVKRKILNLHLRDTENALIEKEDTTKLIVNYSEKRAKKDKNNREKGLARLEKRIKSGKLTKSSINNRGYNKYLKLDGQIQISIDRDKYEADKKWDGLKGYLTNTDMNAETIISNYKHLWKIEKAFRISKNELKIRPIFHRNQRRIEAHICISFVAYKVYKELERVLKENRSKLSPEKAITIAKTIYAIKVKTQPNNKILKQTLLLNKEQKYLARIFGF